MTLFLLQRYAVNPAAGRPTCGRTAIATGSFKSIPHSLATRRVVGTWISTCAAPTDARPQVAPPSPRVTKGNVMKTTLKLTALIAVFGCAAYAYDTRGEALVAVTTTATASTLRLAINPQPLPPRYPRDPIPTNTMQLSDSVIAVNPQPLPPRYPRDPIPTNTSQLSGEVIAINPQPLPPDRDSVGGLLAQKTMPIVPTPLDEPPMMPVPLRVASSGQPSSAVIA